MPEATLRHVMTPDPIVLEADATVLDAARCMRDRDVGNVLVAQDGRLRGIVTDRDLVIRCLASSERDPREQSLAELCTGTLVTLPPDAEVSEAVRLMEENAVRRIPIVDGEHPVGIVSIGDLAIARDGGSALAQISAAPPSE